MKSATPALVTFLNSIRPSSDASLITSDLFTITLTSGTVLTYSSTDLPVSWNGYTYVANSILISGLRYKSSCGVAVDKQQITIMARAADTIGGIPFLQALQHGLFDGAFIQREKAFFTTWGGVPIGTVILFKGRVAQIDSIGRTTATVTVASDLTLLEINMPKNVYQATCTHVFCDTGCSLSAATFSATGSVTSASSLTTVYWTGATTNYQQGTILFTSGTNTGTFATIKSSSAGVMTLAYPLLNIPGIGDTFVATWGCDHTMSKCSTLYGNLSNFKGFPFVPPPQVITGPLSSVTTSGK
jgi:uncharacterized phage protein (TIGR02218 family)